MAIGEIIGAILASPELAALVLTAFATVVTALVGWVGYAVRRHVLRRLSAQELALVREIAAVAVRYAEQKLGKGAGAAKLELATAAANRFLAAYGVKVSAEQLLAIVEAAVFAETAQWHEFAATSEALAPELP